MPVTDTCPLIITLLRHQPDDYDHQLLATHFGAVSCYYWGPDPELPIITLSVALKSKFLKAKAMMHGFFKMNSISCRIVSDTLLSMCKIRIPIVSMMHQGSNSLSHIFSIKKETFTLIKAMLTVKLSKSCD